MPEFSADTIFHASKTCELPQVKNKNKVNIRPGCLTHVIAHARLDIHLNESRCTVDRTPYKAQSFIETY